MTRVDSVARRYAKALFELCDPEILDGVHEALAELAEVFSNHDYLQVALRDPNVTVAERVSVARELAQMVRSDDGHFSNFISLVVENNRADSLPAIADAFELLIQRMRELAAIQVTTARELPESEREVFEQRLRDELKMGVVVDWQVDPELLGGAVFVVGDRELDGSVRSALEEVRSRLVFDT